mmetsp:Transcript_6857/g.12106  ORF Transcript_6857/g.12106 Transcript_6857/m.12106 type:complete len:207 (-) Transcript_6857:138-758(-)
MVAHLFGGSADTRYVTTSPRLTDHQRAVFLSSNYITDHFILDILRCKADDRRQRHAVDAHLAEHTTAAACQLVPKDEFVKSIKVVGASSAVLLGVKNTLDPGFVCFFVKLNGVQLLLADQVIHNGLHLFFYKVTNSLTKLHVALTVVGRRKSLIPTGFAERVRVSERLEGRSAGGLALNRHLSRFANPRMHLGTRSLSIAPSLGSF